MYAVVIVIPSISAERTLALASFARDHSRSSRRCAINIRVQTLSFPCIQNPVSRLSHNTILPDRLLNLSFIRLDSTSRSISDGFLRGPVSK